MCHKCGQTAQKVGVGMYQFIPCSCPIDKEAYRERMDRLRKRIEEAYAKSGSERP